jgi:integrase
VALYLTEQARRLAPSTLAQRLSAIQHVHDEDGKKSPTRSKAVRNVMRGIRRETGWQLREARPLLTEDIKAMVGALPGDEKAPRGTEARASWLRGKRDRALILIGYAGALRRSEIASLHAQHIEDRPEGLLLTVPESKTEQEGEGQLVALRRAGSKYCPAKALWDWLGASGIEEGAVFRGVRRDGRIRTDGLSGRAVNNAVQRAAREAGIRGSGKQGGTKTTISGHSLRAGHVTQASMAGAPEAAIRAQSRHESRGAFDKYVRPQRLMENSSSAELGL